MKNKQRRVKTHRLINSDAFLIKWLPVLVCFHDCSTKDFVFLMTIIPGTECLVEVLPHHDPIDVDVLRDFDTVTVAVHGIRL